MIDLPIPQFSLKRLFVSVTLIAVGVACLLWFRELLPTPRLELGEADALRPWYAYPILALEAACITFAIVSLARKRKPWV